ncbi:mitochondrial chaperone BCS1 protein [Dioscorea alata]|uniref:Mitochondrial chaperone BCS1 protein n=1 Tax=Dioscorea alata TaxID=55571 RepID=A0ACB7TQW2_DIOAL|nr:mitochondrial chaperone BCS1 protein [Dioscorea alata]
MPSESKKATMITAKTMLSTAASLAASIVVVRTIINDVLPNSLRHHILNSFHNLLGRHFSSQLTITIKEYNGFFPNEIYQATETYLSTKISPNTRRLYATKIEGEKTLEITMHQGEEIIDTFQGVQFKWKCICHQTQHEIPTPSNFHYRGSIMSSVERIFVVSFHQKHKSMVLESYFPHILSQAKAIKNKGKAIKLHAVKHDRVHRPRSDMWSAVNLNHPATFETVAMEQNLKQELIADLERFVRRKEYYKKVGKAWKRGYLLYGPPGTGKSSLIAAMANFLKFDVYDLELTAIHSNSELRKLLVSTANRSILVVEDIDCNIELENRKELSEMVPRIVHSSWHGGFNQEKITLSGLLNFIDGLWSSCGDERIIIFTTNHKDRLDHALLRPGRMDMHIYMGYCSPCGFKILLSNYHSVENHGLCEVIERLIQEIEVTPAVVAEELMKSDIVDVALEGLIKFLENKMIESTESKDKVMKFESHQGEEAIEIEKDEE